jgi:hypothetical protein
MERYIYRFLGWTGEALITFEINQNGITFGVVGTNFGSRPTDVFGMSRFEASSYICHPSPLHSDITVIQLHEFVSKSPYLQLQRFPVSLSIRRNFLHEVL